VQPQKTSVPIPIPIQHDASKNYCVLDVETQRSAEEVGGWHRADRMGISCVVIYDSIKDKFIEYKENKLERLFDEIKRFDLIIGFNILKFDYSVLSGYTDYDFRKLNTLDLLQEIHQRLGYRLSLDNIASVTLGKKKDRGWPPGVAVVETGQD